MSATGEAMDARITGWGPDFSEVIAACPLKCGWEQDWNTDETIVTLALIADAVRGHLAHAHGREPQ